MQQPSLEPNAVISSETTTEKSSSSSDPTVLSKKLDSTTAETLASSSPKSSLKNHNKPVIPPHKKDTRKLFVGGLGKQVNNDNFKSFFEKYGKVIDSIVMIDRDTNRHRGFGFVTFQDPEVAQRVLSMSNQGQPVPEGGWKSGKIEIYGKMCEVKASEPKKGQVHVSSCKSSCSSESSGAELVPANIQFHNYQTTNGDKIQNHVVMDGKASAAAGSGYYNRAMPNGMTPFTSSIPSQESVPGPSSAGMDAYSVLNMGQVNPIPTYAASSYPSATSEYYYPSSSYTYQPYYDHTIYNPYFYSYHVPESVPVHNGLFPGQYYYPVAGAVAGNHNYGASYFHPSTPALNSESSGLDCVSASTKLTDKSANHDITKNAKNDVDVSTRQNGQQKQ